MWQNKILGKEISLYAVFKVKGVNLDSFVNVLARKAEIKNIKKTDLTITFWAKYGDIKKVFALAEELCYNDIRIIRYRGLGYPLYYFTKNVGIFLGAVLFALIVSFSNDFIFSFSFSGSGSVYQKEVENYLLNRGIKPFTRFSEVNLKELSSDILSDFSCFSFTECRKKGNRLSIELIASKKEPQVLTGKAEALTVDENGMIEELKVYRGTALFGEGDTVKSGDVVVKGFAVIKDQTVAVNVIATLILNVEKKAEYISELDNQEEYFSLFFLGQTDKNVLDYYVNKQKNADNKYVYEITYHFRKVFVVG